MEPEDLIYFNPFADTRKTSNHLPHWQQLRATYFITYRLADSIPSHLRAAWESERQIWLEHHPEPWSAEVEMEYHRRFSQQMERWLDAGHGSCVLRDPGVRAIVERGITHFEGARYATHAWVPMPNHLHLLLSLREGEELGKILHFWKSYTAKQIHALRGTSGTLWQEDYFDRLIRDGDHFANCVRYVRRNPVKGRVPPGGFTCFESELAKRFAPEA